LRHLVKIVWCYLFLGDCKTRNKTEMEQNEMQHKRNEAIFIWLNHKYSLRKIVLSVLIRLGYYMYLIFFHRFWIGFILDGHLKLEMHKCTNIFLEYSPFIIWTVIRATQYWVFIVQKHRFITFSFHLFLWWNLSL
jgi:hypothetical protein